MVHDEAPPQGLASLRPAVSEEPWVATVGRAMNEKEFAVGSVPMRRAHFLAFLPGCRHICAQTNARYLDALAHVDDPTPAIRALDALTARASSPNARTVRPFNPLSRHDRMLFEALLRRGRLTTRGSWQNAKKLRRKNPHPL
jgi:hypothetical protein